LSAVKPNVASLSDLKDKRKHENKYEINEKIKRWEDRNPVIMVREPPKKVQSANTRTSMKDIKEENKRLARIKCGLSSETKDIKISKNAPTLAYVYDPVHKTQNDLKEMYLREKQDVQLKLTSKVHKDDVDRLNEREDEVFAKLYSDQDRFCLSKLKEKRRKENFDDNLNKFSRRHIGVHGHELPKFSESEENKEFWKHRDGYVDNPKFNSQVEYKELNKFWKNPEGMLIDEHKDYIEPVGKKLPKVIEKREELIIKVNTLNHFKDFDPNNPTPLDLANPKGHVYRWTALEHQFNPMKFKKGRYFDNLKELSLTASEEKDLYNSMKSPEYQSYYMKK
jgi:hypothetical protein